MWGGEWWAEAGGRGGGILNTEVHSSVKMFLYDIVLYTMKHSIMCLQCLAF